MTPLPFRVGPLAAGWLPGKVEVLGMGGIFHLKYPRMKHEENSPQGDLEAKRKGYYGIDHDAQKGASGISYNTHWKDVFARDKFADPLHKVGAGTKFHQLDDNTIRRLVAHTGDETFHIRSTASGIRHAAKVGLHEVMLELKPGNNWTVSDCRHFKRIARRAGIRLTVMTMDNWAGWRRTLLNARLAGCRTRRLYMSGR